MPDDTRVKDVGSDWLGEHGGWKGDDESRRARLSGFSRD